MASNADFGLACEAAGPIPAHAIVTWGAADGVVLVANAPTDALIGVTDENAAAHRQRVRVLLVGVAIVQLGGPVVRGDRLTADAHGFAVVVGMPAPGAVAHYIGIALESGRGAERIDVLIQHGIITTPALPGAELPGAHTADGAPLWGRGF